MARAFPGARPGPIDEALAALRRVRRRLRERRCQLIARPRGLDGQHAVVNILEGPKLLVDCGDYGLSRNLMAHGYWELWLTEAIEALLKPGMIAIDIGANLGYFTMLMAKLVGSRGRVHAFEPNPVMGELLMASAALNGCGARISLHGEPLWDESGRSVVLKVPAGEPKNAHLVADPAESEEGHRLTTRRLDSFPELLQADLIKIDVEGAEEAIWRGMAKLFDQRRPLTVFLEFTPVRYCDSAGFLAAIERDGFALGELSISHGIRTVSPAEILAGDPSEDRMLALRRT